MPLTPQQSYSVGFGVGFLCILTLSFLQTHPNRRRIWIPFGYFLLLAANVVVIAGGQLWWIGLLAGGGLAAGTVGSTRYYAEPLVGLAAVVVALFAYEATRAVPAVPIVMSGVCAAFFALALWLNRRYVAETLLEWPVRIMYRIRAVGRGMKEVPRTGPVLIIANHVSYLDPCWIMIRIPRDLTPIMYGEYYNMRGIHFYMKHLIGAIPSGVGTFRREAPELDEAVRRLDRREGLLVFPEGQVRRKEEEELRRFAQGVWRVLRDRPATPVVACWIEGGWGSWSSFKGGPPFKGKRIDVRRPIDITVSAPVVLDAETLADQHRTRELLRQMVLDARRHLGEPGA
jgi:1-acyl-sn-glycerol-3-phosphate acyltransferase